jgi:hypothetical protein
MFLAARWASIELGVAGSILILLAGFRPAIGFGAACCGKSSAAPFLITGDDQLQVSFGVSLGNTVGYVGDNGVPNFGSSGESQVSQAYKLDLTTLLTDRLQAGVSLPVLTYASTRGLYEESSIGIGDVRISLGYEVMPSWTYSDWKPQGFLFTALTLPTGKSYFDGDIKRLGTNVTGLGYYSWSVGALFQKKWAVWDTFVVPEGHYSFARTSGDSGGTFSLHPGFGGSLGLGFGWSPGAGSLRMGFRVQPRLEQGIQLSSLGLGGNVNLSQGAWVSVCDTGFDASYMASSMDSISVSYTDQTLLGPAMNTNLSRILGLNYQHRWER